MKQWPWFKKKFWNRCSGKLFFLTVFNQYLGRGFHGSIRRGGDYTDDWHHSGQWLRYRCGHRRRGYNSRHHPNREWQRRRWGSHNRHGNRKGWRRSRVRHQGNGRGRRGYTGLRRGGGRARKWKRRRVKSEKRKGATSQGR